MALTEARSKAKPKRNLKKEDLKTGIRIQVEDLRVGDRIVLNWHRADTVQPVSDEMMDYIRLQVAGGDMSLTKAQELIFDEILDQTETRYVNRTKKVDRIDICESAWRTHIHVNKMDCYDTRQFVWVVHE